MTPQKRLMVAVWSGNPESIVGCIDDGADPKAENSFALTMAAMYGHSECVKLLIPLSDAKSEGSWALRIAADNGHTDCVRLLIPVSDLEEAKRLLEDNTDAIRLIDSISQEDALKPARTVGKTKHKP